MILLGIDTGGTFTDFVLIRDNNLRIHKVLSTPAAPERAILQGMAELGLDSGPDHIVITHGSTVATNAVLEGKLAHTVFVTNRGMGDMLTLGRGARRQLYQLMPEPVAPPVPPALCLETGGRLAADGKLVEPLSKQDLQQLKQQIRELAPEAVAINLLFSYLNHDVEKQIASVIDKTVFVSRSSEVLPEIKEYERGISTWLNAAVGPIVQGYLQRLEQGAQQNLNAGDDRQLTLSVMQSAGGTIEARQAARQGVHMLLSGPAGGLAGARFVADCSGHQRLLTFDMGGTSTDVALIDGDIQLTNESVMAHYPVAVPMVDMHTIGAGGGSIASIDQGGLLQVGPQSAGADPGPACYGKGAGLATVTDANLVLGRLQGNAFLGGGMQLDTDAAREALQGIADPLGISIERAALGVVELANEHMARALRVMSVQRGLDPQELTLVSFGGAGGLHVCALADALGMKQAMVPIHAGVLSALGMLAAPRARFLSHSHSGLLADMQAEEINAVLTNLAQRGRPSLLAEGISAQEISDFPAVDLRYQGQSYALSVPWQDIAQTCREFHRLHQARYGHRLDLPVELVTIRLKLEGRNQHQDTLAKMLRLESTQQTQALHQVLVYGVDEPVSILARDQLAVADSYDGPLIITDVVATTWVAPNWSVSLDKHANLVLRKN